jgi:hypothetical protein
MPGLRQRGINISQDLCFGGRVGGGARGAGGLRPRWLLCCLLLGRGLAV